MSTIELPLKANEAASIADVIFQQRARPDRRLRQRLGGRVAGMGLTSLRCYWGSLQQDRCMPPLTIWPSMASTPPPRNRCCCAWRWLRRRPAPVCWAILMACVGGGRSGGQRHPVLRERLCRHTDLRRTGGPGFSPSPGRAERHCSRQSTSGDQPAGGILRLAAC